MFSCFKRAELFCRSLNGLSFCVNLFQLISCLAMAYAYCVSGHITGYKFNKSEIKLHYVDLSLMKILGKHRLQLFLEKNVRLVKVTKCVQSISFQMTF